MKETQVASWVQGLTEGRTGGAPFKIGDIVKHPSGRMVKVVEGQYWGTYGLSNFWGWREVLPKGKLGPRECGYGWRPSKKERL